ncbi:uncharacterized protein LOC8080691 [Sorghum bicolor]|uniref:uncharacterized protein LOC8080691 n=1 Tax=Sorghum bicolor TaxID=4558 RepID=UPI000B4263C8|nr:uncharacterized protein LOC8080691 [Sorghum bicolor]|eukprot:XP_021309260.1 uncharacterized protein LOC8080691 [Sorghum bicolor]
MADAAACDGGGEAGKVERAERSLGSGWRRPRSDLIPRRWSSRGRQMGLARVLELSRTNWIWNAAAGAFSHTPPASVASSRTARRTASAPSPTTSSSRSSPASAAPAPPRTRACSRAGGAGSGLTSPRSRSTTSRPARSTPRSPWLPAPRRRSSTCTCSSLLGAAAALAPAEIVVHVTGGILGGPLELPCFDRTVSIKLDLYFVRFTLPPAGGFLALESLHLENGCIDLSDLLPRCPRLRKLLIPFWNSQSIVVRSPSLEEFSVHANFNIAQLEIVAPALKRLYMDAYRGIHDDCNVVFAAPAVKDLTWKCECKALTYMFGVIWRMWSLTFEYTQLDNNIDSQSVCLQSQHRPFVGVLSLSLETNVLPGDVSKTFEQEIYRFQVTDCSVLELDLIQQGHVYGTIVLHLLGLCTSIQRLKVTLDEFLREDSCYANCWCDQPNNWRSQSISLIDLKEVEIYRFRGQDHEVDLLKVLLRCATVLERVTLGFSRKVSSSDSACMKIVGILEDYPSVKCNFYQYGKLIFMRE